MDPAYLVISALPPDIGELARLASSEGFGMVRRLIDDYVAERNRFSEQAECLCAAVVDARTIAIGGINVDPYYNSSSRAATGAGGLMLDRAIILASAFVVGCSDGSVSAPIQKDALGDIVGTAGFPCQEGVSSEVVGDTDGGWRISCGQALVYLASMSAGDEICIEPVRFVDSVAPAPVVHSEERCVSVSSAAL